MGNATNRLESGRDRVMMAAKLGDHCMTEAAEENPLDGIKGKLNEVIELLNQPNLPVAVSEDAELTEPKE